MKFAATLRVGNAKHRATSAKPAAAFHTLEKIGDATALRATARRRYHRRMISDKLSRLERYAALSPSLAAAMKFLADNPASLTDGRHDILGDDCFALVQGYVTKPLAQAEFEAHRIYTDIQLIVSGEETLLWSPLENVGPVTKPYVAEKDIAFFASPAKSTALNLRAGEFAIFFPEDAHAPGVQTNGPHNVRKIVVKVRV